MVDPEVKQQEAPLLSGAQTINSIRDTGYKGTDYALAELIDNSFQWGNATSVLLLIVQRTKQAKQRATKRIDELWVIDDGRGMTAQALNLALSFGGSGNYNDRSGIGRFGMGLPQASVSQCTRTDMWTWQSSQPDNAIHTSLNLKSLGSGDSSAPLTVPWPTGPSSPNYEAMPDWVRDVFYANAVPDTSMGQPLYSGTAVRWTQLDRLRWLRADTMFDHTEKLLGRIYRKFLTADGTSRRNIRVAVIDGDGESIQAPENFRDVRPNDPLFLTSPAETTLEYWEIARPAADGSDSGKFDQVTDVPPFIPAQEVREYQIRRPDGAGTATVTARLSKAKPEARPGRNAGGSTRQGLHARDNAGISVMRAGRELVLEKTLAYEATDRWWGIEVTFDPCLDEVFGVTNNKQEAPYFSQALRLAREYGEPKSWMLDEGLFDDDHPLAELYNMAYDLVVNARSLKEESKKERQATDKTKQKQPTVTSVASGVKKTRAEVSPTPGEAAFAQTKPDPGQAADVIDKALQEQEVSTEARTAILANYERGVTVQVIERAVKQTPAFFWPDEALNLEFLCVNNAHPAYASLIEPLRASNEAIQAMSEEEAKKLLVLSADAVTWMLLAWSRYENEHRGSAMSGKIQEVREGWGRRLKEFVEDPAFKLSGLIDEDDEELDSEDAA